MYSFKYWEYISSKLKFLAFHPLFVASRRLEYLSFGDNAEAHDHKNAFPVAFASKKYTSDFTACFFKSVRDYPVKKLVFFFKCLSNWIVLESCLSDV